MKLYYICILLTALFVSGCSNTPSGVFYVPKTPPPDGTKVRVCIYDNYVPTIIVTPAAYWTHPIVILNGQNTLKTAAKLSAGSAGVQWTGYETQECNTMPHSNADINLGIFTASNGKVYNPRTEKPRRIEVYYLDQQNRPVYWSVNLTEQN